LTSVVEALVSTVLPVFLVIGVGAFVSSRVHLEASALNRVALYVVVPALVFRSMSQMDVEVGGALRFVAAYLTFMAAVAGTAALVARRWSPRDRRTFVATSTFANAANMMLPVTLFALGDAGLQRALILYVVTALTIFGVGPLMLGAGSPLAVIARKVALFPVLWAAVLGLVVNGLGWTLPVPVFRAVDLLAGAAVPIVMLTLGVHVGRARSLVPDGRTWTSVAMKLALAPVLGYFVGIAWGLSGIDLAVLILLAGMPTAVNVFNVSVEFGGNADQVGRAVVTGTILAVVTLPLVVTFVTRLA
jgi:predicted permease